MSSPLDQIRGGNDNGKISPLKNASGRELIAKNDARGEALGGVECGASRAELEPIPVEWNRQSAHKLYAVIPRESGEPSTPQRRWGYWVAAFRGR